MKKTLVSLVLASAGCFTAGCAFEHGTTPLAPTPAASTPSSGSSPTTNPVAGAWQSQAGTPAANSCSSFQLQLNAQTSTSVDGSFSATCDGGVTIAGTASGQLQGTTLTLSVSGTAGFAGALSCAFSIAGSATMAGANDALSITYTGTTCLGPIHGNEMLRRPAPAAPPAPPPAPAPTPAPEPVDPLFGCGGLTEDKGALVSCIHSHIHPTDEYGAFEVTKRVAWALRGEGAGLLIKNGGENIVPWQGYSFSAGRICYPDGHIIKVLSDVGPGGANGPAWQDNGFVDPSLYVPAIDPSRP